mgnify:FL=1
MKKETFEKDKNHELYKYSAVPFIEKLLALNVPLSAINTNDFNSSYMPRVFVTREYGRDKGGETRKEHLTQFGHKAAARLAKFYHS